MHKDYSSSRVQVPSRRDVGSTPFVHPAFGDFVEVVARIGPGGEGLGFRCHGLPVQGQENPDVRQDESQLLRFVLQW